MSLLFQGCLNPHCEMAVNLPCSCLLCRCINISDSECLTHIPTSPNRSFEVTDKKRVQSVRKKLKRRMKIFEKQQLIMMKKNEKEQTESQTENEAAKRRQNVYLKRLTWGIKQQQKSNIDPHAMLHPWSMSTSKHSLIYNF